MLTMSDGFAVFAVRAVCGAARSAVPARTRAVSATMVRDSHSPARIWQIMALLSALADELYREEVARARAMRPSEKLLEGPRLFDRGCQLMADGIRHRQPGFDDDAVLARVEAQLTLAKALDTKLRWGMGANRSKDRDDIHNMLAVQGPLLDWAYLDRWAGAHGTTQLLEEIRASVPLV